MMSKDATPVAENVELLPCPFCGGDAALRGHQAPEFWVFCDAIGCKASTEAFGSKQRAISAWNTRADPAIAAAHEAGRAEGVRAAAEDVSLAIAALKMQNITQDEHLPSSIAREQGLTWLEGWFDLPAALSKEPTK